MDALRRRSTRSRAWLLTFAFGLVGCARAAAPVVAIDPTSSLATARQELAHAETLRRLGHEDEAAATARRAAEHARLDVVLAEQSDDDDARREAKRRWRRSSAVAWKLARRTNDREAQLEAALASPAPQRYRGRLRRLPGGPQTSWSTLDDAHVRLARRGEDDVPWLDPDRRAIAEARLERFDELPRRLRNDPERAAAALRDAIAIDAKREDLVERATALLDEDPWHVPAMVLLAVARDVAAGRVREDPQLYGDAFGGYGLGALARLHVRSQATKVASLRLAWILAAAENGLVGDAAAALLELAPTKSEGAPAEALAAILALGRGDTDAFTKWRRAHDEASVWLDEHVARFDAHNYAPAMRTAGRAARRRHVDDRTLSEYDALAIAADPEATLATRRRAERSLSRSLVRLARECVRIGDAHDDCLMQRNAYVMQGSSPLAREPSLRAKVLRARGSAAFWSEWTTWSTAPRDLDETEMASSPWFQRAAFDTAMRDADTDRARRALRSHHRTLPVESLVAAALAKEDLEAGAPAIATHDVPALESFGEHELRAAREDGMHAELAAAFAAAAEDRDREAAEILGKLAPKIEGRAGAWFSALHGLAALRAGDTKAYAAALARTDRLAPDCALVHWLRGHAALEKNEPRDARRHFAAALHRDATLTAAFDGLLEATLRSPGTTAATIRSLLDAAPPGWVAEHAELVHVARRGRWKDPRDFAKVWLLLEREPPDDALELAPIDPGVAERVIREAWRRLPTLEDRAEIDALADAMLAAIPHVRDPDQWVVDAASLHFLRNRPKEALEVSSRERPLDRFGMRSLLFEARSRGEIDDAMAFAMWRTVWAKTPNDDALDPTVEAWLAAADSEIEIPLACHLYFDNGRTAEALGMCRRARELHPRSTVLTVQWSVSTARAEEAAWDGLAASLFDAATPPTFAAQPVQPIDASVGTWFQHRALWLTDRGRHREAAAAWIEAFALDEWPPDDEPLPQIPFRGWTFRTMEVEEDSEPTERSILLAIAEGRVDIARADAAAAIAASGESRPQWRYTLGRAARLAEIAGADLSAHRLDAAALGGAFGLIDGSAELDAAVAFHRAHPASTLAAVFVVEAALDEDRLDEADAALRSLVAEHPREPLVAVLAASVAIRRDDPTLARSAMRDADTTVLGGALGQWAELPEPVRGHDEELDALRTPEAFAKAMRSDEPARPLQRIVAIGAGIEIGLPPGWKSDVQADRVTVSQWDHSLGVQALPRAERCNGRACAEPVLAELRRAGATILWTRATRLPAGEATQIVAATRDETLVRWVVPLGARIFVLRGAAPHDDRRDGGAALLHAARSFRPLDGVLSAYDAESLRTAGLRLDERVRAAARAGFFAAPKSGACSVAAQLAGLDDATIAALLLDLWLATPHATDRARLVPCAAPKSPRASRLGLVALLDEAPDLAAFGRAVVQAQPDAAIADARLLLPQHDSALADPQRLVARELPPRGTLELALALPLGHARTFVSTLLASDDPHRRAMAWAATDLRDDLVDRGTALARLGGDATEALRAARFLARPANADELARVREALDRSFASDHAERELVEALAILVAKAGDAADAKRLATASGRVLDDPRAADEVTTSRAFLRDIATAHTLLVADAPAPKKNARVARLLDRWRAPESQAPTKLRGLDELRAPSLAALLPGRDWVFARVGNPALLSAAARSLLRRIQGERPAETQILARMLTAMLDGPAARLVQEDHGLDLSRPIECASREFPAKGMICSAFVTDRERVLSALGQRDHGEDAGVTLPLGLTTQVPVAPMALSLLPVFLHGLVHEEAGGPTRRRIAAERARDLVDAGPSSAYRYLIVHAYEDEISIDTERYLFVGDRLFVLTTLSAQDDLLSAHDGPTLADDPDYRALTGAWAANTASLAAIAVGSAAPTDAPTTAEIVVESDGVRILIRSRLPNRPAPSRLAAALPDGAASTIVVGPEVWRPSGKLEDVPADDPDRARLPPTEALRRARDVAFGWYPRAGESLWQRWVAVLEDSPAVDRALRTAGLRVGKTLLAKGGLHTIRRGGHVVVATDPALVTETLARLDAPPPPGDAPLVIGTYDGKIAAAAITGMTNATKMPGESRRAFGMIAGAIRHASYRADLEAKTGILTLTGRVQLAVADEETPAIVDGWLAAKDGGNSTKLPRRLRVAELDAPLAYEIEVDDAQWFVDHVVRPSARTTATVRDATHVLLEVRPTAVVSGKPLARADRERHTAPTSSFPTRDPAITKLLGSVVGDAKSTTDRATKITEFVHGRIRYAVTPRQPDGVEILATGEGDCSEYSTLTVTLLRAAGIPAFMVQGMLASDDSMVAHAWVAFHDGQSWREIDPTGGMMNVTAGHIELSLIDALSLHSLGRLKVSAIGAAPKRDSLAQ